MSDEFAVNALDLDPPSSVFVADASFVEVERGMVVLWFVQIRPGTERPAAAVAVRMAPQHFLTTKESHAANRTGFERNRTLWFGDAKAPILTSAQIGGEVPVQLFHASMTRVLGNEHDALIDFYRVPPVFKKPKTGKLDARAEAVIEVVLTLPALGQLLDAVSATRVAGRTAS